MLRAVLLLTIYIFTSRVTGIVSSDIEHRARFLLDLSQRHAPTTIVGLMPLQSKTQLVFYKGLSSKKFVSELGSSAKELSNGRIMFVADLNENDTLLILQRPNILRDPSVWVLFYKILDSDTNHKKIINSLEIIFSSVYIPINSQVFVAVQRKIEIHVWLVYQIKREKPLIWEDYAVWNSQSGFDRPPSVLPLAIRRLDLRGEEVSATTVILDNNTKFEHMEKYLFRSVDTPAKMTYHMVLHLFEWLNATGFINTTKSWGYYQRNGSFDGVVGELAAGRSEFSGNVFFLTKDRISVVQYVMSPCPSMLTFVFKKPALASVANIYQLPFSGGVWASLLVLILASILALFVVSFWDVELENKAHETSAVGKLSQSFLDTMCLVFQQGTPADPVSVTSRHILLLGLLSFMFLLTAYSANVVALLQSSTNDIDSVEALLKSPLQIGAQNLIYNRQMFLVPPTTMKRYTSS